MFRKFFYLFFVLLLSVQKVMSFHSVTENNRVLVGHVFHTTYTSEWLKCIQVCQDEPRCTSYNYEKSTGDTSLCELNDCGLENLCGRDKSLICSPAFLFQQIRERKVSGVRIAPVSYESKVTTKQAFMALGLLHKMTSKFNS